MSQGRPHRTLLVQGYFPAGVAAGARLLQAAPDPGVAARPVAPHVAAALAHGRSPRAETHAASTGRPGPFTVLPFTGPHPTQVPRGRPLPASVRRWAEGWFAADLSAVQLHTASGLARVGARAATAGAHVGFAPGFFDPESTQGKGLIAHELAHVLQQRAGRLSRPPVSGVVLVQDPRLEAEAQAAYRALGFRSGPPVAVQPYARAPFSGLALRGGTVIQRQDGDYFQNGQVEVREVHGVDETRQRNPAIYLRRPGTRTETLISYRTYSGEDDLIYLLHIDSLNMGDGAGGISWLALHQFAEQAQRMGRGRVMLGTAVVDKTGLTKGEQAAVHIYRTLGFDVSSAVNVSRSVVNTADILRISGGKLGNYRWQAGRMRVDDRARLLPPAAAEDTGCCCYLTSACVRFLGLPADGEELTVLRAFRDGHMSATRERRALVARYYDGAPKIVAVLDSSAMAVAAYLWIYGEIRAAVGLLREGNRAAAQELYVRAVETLAGRLLGSTG